MSRVASSTPRTDPRTWRELVDEAGVSLGSASEARWIAEDVNERAGLTYREVTDAAPDTTLRAQFGCFVRRRIAGEPLQHVLGHWPFRTIDLLVDRRALIPRPETELVVEYVLRELQRVQRSPLVVDLGTGSGAIACSVASEHPEAKVVAIEKSGEAVELAISNRDRLDADVARRIDVRIGDWFEALPLEIRGRVDLVVSNPPYIAEHEWSGLEPVVRDFDPKAALVAGPLGTEAIANVIAGTPDVIADGGGVVVEIAPSQSVAARALARAAGARAIDVQHDFAGRDRVLIARW